MDLGVTWKPEDFSRIWGLYPRKELRADAEKAWNKLQPNETDIEAMAKYIHKRMEDLKSDWSRGIGIPMMPAFLAHRLWLDDEV